MSRPRPDHVSRLRVEAVARNAEWAALPVKSRLEALDSRPGESKKQRAKLLAEAANAGKAQANAEAVATRKSKKEV